ncbi:MAG: phosphotransferase [Bacteroidetes bacterium]|nr:phosphotransferase [Bacteroidota bacterium]
MKAEGKLLHLYNQWSGHEVRTIVPLPQSGSSRSYFRLTSDQGSAIGAYHTDDAENQAFVYFARHFKNQGLAVPEILAEDLDNQIYLQQDLGDQTLFAQLQDCQEVKDDDCMAYLNQAVDGLPFFQKLAHQNLNYSLAYPRQAFDAQSMRWDLNYFKYHFLKFTGLNFKEQNLENDFDEMIRVLDGAEKNFFLYRDFQTRNIMIHDNKVWFIDFQGVRMGHPAYDLASLLFDAKADIPPNLREVLFERYMVQLKAIPEINADNFRKYYPGFVLIRKLQALGAFGFRGLFEGKTHFLQSIPYALDNFTWILENYSFPFKFPELRRLLKEMANSRFRYDIEERIKKVEV